MKKFAFVAVVSFGFVGCASSGDEWNRGLKNNREAVVCGKEIVQVPMSAHADPGMTRTEYRIQLTWYDAERGTHPMLWSVVSEKNYQVINLSDKFSMMPGDIGQMDGHVTVIYYWTDDRLDEINEIKYEFDLSYDPVG